MKRNCINKLCRRRCSLKDILIGLLTVTLACNIILLFGTIRTNLTKDYIRSMNLLNRKPTVLFKKKYGLLKIQINSNKGRSQAGDKKITGDQVLRGKENIQKYDDVCISLCTVYFLILLIQELPSETKIPSKRSWESTLIATVTTTTTITTTAFKPTQTTSVKKVSVSSKRIHVKVLSSKETVSIMIDKKSVYKRTSPDDNVRGIHVVILNQYTGAVMSAKIFDVYSTLQDDELVRFLKMVQRDRIIIFTIKDEGSANLHLPAKRFIESYGSQRIRAVGYRDSWAFISIHHQWLVEGHRTAIPGGWALPLTIQAFIELQSPRKEQCRWGVGELLHRRKQLCDKFEGYGAVCDCHSPETIDLRGSPLINSQVSDIPISVVAGNRPYYLFRMLRRLLTTPGVEPEMVTVYIDGFFDEVVAILKLFNVRYVQHIPVCSKNCRIAQHYVKTLRETFDEYPSADYMIILEEDLDVSKDIMDYFSQLVPLLASDPSVFCVSAWNDQGYHHSCNDPSMVYRVETMPGLGWVLKRKLFKEELEPKWPKGNVYFDWDMWMRQDSILKGRECIIPDISRTYHFGAKGLNVNPTFQEAYFLNHTLNTAVNVKLNISKITKQLYEDDMQDKISKAEVLDHSKTPCSHTDFIPDTHGHTYVMYIHQNKTRDWDTWNNVARCFKLWDLDVRGFHKQMWRFWIKKNRLFVVGSSSPYFKYKPDDVTPIFMLDEVRVKREAEREAERKKEERRRN